MGRKSISSCSGPSSPVESVRKRVHKACDRCRFKKCKCDGVYPCSKCEADDLICVFRATRKSSDKVYSRRYVETLERHQARLVAGLQELYRRLQTEERWVEATPHGTSGNVPSAQDILERIGIFQQDKQDSSYRVYKDTTATQTELPGKKAALMEQKILSNTSSKAMKSPKFEAGTCHTMSSSTDSSSTQLFPTPPVEAPNRTVVRTCLTSKNQTFAPATPLTDQYTCQAGPVEQDPVDFNMYDLSVDDIQATLAAPEMIGTFEGMTIDPCLTMQDWQDWQDWQSLDTQQLYQGGFSA